MTWLKNILSKQSQQDFSRNQAFILLVCFLLSIFFWLIITLNQKEYTSKLRYPVKFTNIPGEVEILEQSDMRIEVAAEGSGIDLLMEHLDLRRDTLEIPYNQELELGFALTDQHKGKAERLMKEEIKTLDITPDSLYVLHERKISKRVPLYSRIDYQLKPAYQLAEAPTLSPDSIDIIGPRIILDSIEAWYTVKEVIDPIDRVTDFKVQLQQDSRVKLGRNTAKLKVIPLLYTQTKLNIPIQITDVPADQSIRLSHENLQLACLVPMSSYDSLIQQQYAINIRYSDLNRDFNYFKPELDFLPSSVKVLFQKPFQISYMVIEEWSLQE